MDGVNQKLDKILSLLKEHNLCYDIVLKPGELLVHPMNRGGAMVSAHDVHRKGSRIVSTGVKAALLLPSSLCIEVSRAADVRKDQIAKNQALCIQSENLLGAVQGDERYLTLGNSHWVMFCRALEQGALSPSGERLHLPTELKDLVSKGWQWTVLKPEIEESFPNFPSWAASTLNSINTISKATSELECMLQIASMLKQGKTLEECVKAVKETLPTCADHLEEIGHFVKLYAGGNTFPVLDLLKTFCTLTSGIAFYGSSFNGCVLHVTCHTTPRSNCVMVNPRVLTCHVTEAPNLGIRFWLDKR